MASAFERQSFGATGDAHAWTAIVPIVVRAGVVELGERAADWSIGAGPETWHMPDAFEALEALLPALEACLRGIDRSSSLRTVMVGARVAAVADCSAAVMRGAKFPPPKGGSGLVVVPLTITSK